MGNDKHVIRLVLLAGLLVLVGIWFTTGSDIIPINDTPTQIELSLTDFEKFGIAILVFAEMLPAFLKQFYSAGAIGIKLLLQGFSPFILGVILALGQLVGQMILYVIGMFAKAVKKGSIGDLAGKNHFLHQHHFLVFLAVPFASVLGDAVMLYSGHEKINPLKIIPFLFIANLADNYKWIFTQQINLEVVDAIT